MDPVPISVVITDYYRDIQPPTYFAVTQDENLADAFEVSNLKPRIELESYTASLRQKLTTPTLTWVTLTDNSLASDSFSVNIDATGIPVNYYDL